MPVKLTYFVDIAPMLRAERLRCHVKLKDLAASLGISDSDISGFELRNINWSLDKVMDYARYLGIERQVQAEIAFQLRRMIQ